MPPDATSAAQMTIASWNASTDCGVRREGVPGELRGDERADRGDPDQAGDAGDRVVDRRGDAGVALVRVREHGRGERRDGHRQPDREEESAGRRSSGTTVSIPVRRNSRMPAAASSGPTPMKSRGP